MGEIETEITYCFPWPAGLARSNSFNFSRCSALARSNWWSYSAFWWAFTSSTICRNSSFVIGCCGVESGLGVLENVHWWMLQEEVADGLQQPIAYLLRM